MANLYIDGIFQDVKVPLNADIDGLKVLYPNAVNISVLASEKHEYKAVIRSKIYKEADIDALLGKTANFTAATAAIMLDIFGKMLTANSHDEFKAAIKPYAPLIEKLQEGIKSGEFKSVISAQGLNHGDAIIEGLTAYTTVAQVFEQQKNN